MLHLCLKSLSAIQKIRDMNRYDKRTALTLKFSYRFTGSNELIAPLKINCRH